MKKVRALILLSLTLITAACAPAPAGQSALTPQVTASANTAVTVKPGETRYGQLSYPRQALKVND